MEAFSPTTDPITVSPISTILPFVVWGLLGLCIYFIPTSIARKKNHVQKKAILILNIFLGWTFIGWVIALIWSVLEDKNSKNKNTKTENTTI